MRRTRSKNCGARVMASLETQLDSPGAGGFALTEEQAAAARTLVAKQPDAEELMKMLGIREEDLNDDGN